MSTRSWTDAQLAAIEDKDGSLLVSAAAGSGKTAVLVERAIRMITREEDPVDADRLLILTFTNAAAEELRSRIGLALENAMSHGGDRVRLQKQRILLRRAFIGTLDAFCLQLVREHFSQLGLPPDIAVAEDSLLAQVRADALAETMEALSTEDDFAVFCGLYGRARDDSAAEEAVRELDIFVQSLAHPSQALEAFAAMYRSEAPLCETPWGGELLRYAREALEAALPMARRAAAIAREDGAPEAWAETLEGNHDTLQRVLAAVDAGGWDDARRLLNGYAPLNLNSGKGARSYKSGGREQIARLRDSLKDVVEGLWDHCFICSEAEYDEDRRAAAPLVEVLCRAAAMYAEKTRAALLEQKALDFAGFEHMALGLLQNEDGTRSATAKRVSARYHCVMVDEYQDTNELQAALYECVGREDGSNLFYVGDVKQSIYRFRQANPGIFLQKKHSWTPWQPACAHPAVINLGHNFRSGQGVIGGVNFLFEQLMSTALGEVDYGEGERLIQGGTGGEPKGLEVWLLDDPDKVRDAGWVAARIAAMVAEGTPVRDGDGTRPCRYDDFCILLRSRSAMLQYTEALEAAGVPVVSDMEDELLQTPEVLPLVAVLSAIDNPGDDVSLAATLMGPLFRFGPDEIAALRARRPGGQLWGLLAASKEPKVQAFVEDIHHYRMLAAGMSVGRLCEELVGRTGYLSAVAAMEGGLARRENLLRFMDWAAQVSTGSRGGLSGFVRLLENGGSPSGSGFKGIAGHVSMLSIHRSKGLEYPVCFLADAQHRFNMQDARNRVRMHAALGVGMWLRNGGTLFPTLPLKAIHLRCQRETLSEEMRILYVALTRAKDKLIVSMASDKPQEALARACATGGGEKPSPYLLAQRRSMGDWVLAAAVRHPAAAALCGRLGLDPPTAAGAPCEMVFDIADALAPEDYEKSDYRLDAGPDEALVQRLRAGFEARLPRSALRDLPVKVSVSSLAKPDLPAIPKRPSFMYKSGLTAAERGTAMHSFMQLADYNAAAENAEKEIARLVQAGWMEPEQAKALDREGIAAFLASPLAARMRAASPLLREYDFITTVPAVALEASLEEPLAGEEVFVQGIADAVLVQGGQVEIVDYKTDRGKTAEALVQHYRRQLQLYRSAIEKALELPVTRLTLWSFVLMREIDVKL